MARTLWKSPRYSMELIIYLSHVCLFSSTGRNAQENTPVQTQPFSHTGRQVRCEYVLTRKCIKHTIVYRYLCFSIAHKNLVMELNFTGLVQQRHPCSIGRKVFTFQMKEKPLGGPGKPLKSLLKTPPPPKSSCEKVFQYVLMSLKQTCSLLIKLVDDTNLGSDVN